MYTKLVKIQTKRKKRKKLRRTKDNLHEYQAHQGRKCDHFS